MTFVKINYPVSTMLAPKGPFTEKQQQGNTALEEYTGD